jgi:hypothetical protein
MTTAEPESQRHWIQLEMASTSTLRQQQQGLNASAIHKANLQSFQGVLKPDRDAIWEVNGTAPFARNGVPVPPPVGAPGSKQHHWVLPQTKRASGLNLRNHPSDPHPIGIAIWVLQKIDQARRSEEAISNGSPAAANSDNPSQTWSAIAPKANVNSSSSIPSPPLLNGARPVWIQESQNEPEEGSSRLQAQRERKTKQRQENWAKSRDPQAANAMLRH